MTNEEAKFLLQGYRPNGADAKNPAFAEALVQAERDPELRSWFEREQAFDALVASKLRQVAPPDGLRESILAGTKLSHAQAKVRMASSSPAWWRGFRGMALATAAAVALMAGLWLGPLGGGDRGQVAVLPNAELLLQTALADFRGAHPMGGHPHADELGDFGAWLQNDGSKLDAGKVPVDFAALRQRGCRVIDVAGYSLFEICFRREGQWYHVYIAPRTDFDPGSVHNEPMFHEQGRFVAATWADADNVYLVASTAGIERLRGLL